MNARQTLERLERQCRELGVRLIYDDLRGEGGLCRLRDCYYLIINRRSAVETRVRMISESLVRVEQRPIQPSVEATEVLETSRQPVTEAPTAEQPTGPLVELPAHHQ
jgi:hypothetical protein